MYNSNIRIVLEEPPGTGAQHLQSWQQIQAVASQEDLGVTSAYVSQSPLDWSGP